MTALYMIALDLSLTKGTITEEFYFDMIRKNERASSKRLKKFLKTTEYQASCKKEIKDKLTALSIGRGLDCKQLWKELLS